MSESQWYLEYQIHKNRPGLMGDIASLLGMLSINILSINGLQDDRRGILLQANEKEKIDSLQQVLHRVDNITVTALRPPTVVDRMAVRHGCYPVRDQVDKRIYQFTRDELGLLVDFMAELLKKEGCQVIGIRGMPRVGKTESIVASSVCANKRWVFISSTLLRQTVRSQLIPDEMSGNNVYIIDGIVSTRRASEKHSMLVREIMQITATKVIEHPDIFVRETEYTWDDFDYIIELRNHPNEAIDYEMLETTLGEFDP